MKWIKCSERMPKPDDCDTALVCDNGTFYSIACYMPPGKWIDQQGNEYSGATHWISIHDIPKPEGEK